MVTCWMQWTPGTAIDARSRGEDVVKVDSSFQSESSDDQIAVIPIGAISVPLSLRL